MDLQVTLGSTFLLAADGGPRKRLHRAIGHISHSKTVQTPLYWVDSFSVAKVNRKPRRNFSLTEDSFFPGTTGHVHVTVYYFRVKLLQLFRELLRRLTSYFAKFVFYLNNYIFTFALFENEVHTWWKANIPRAVFSLLEPI